MIFKCIKICKIETLFIHWKVEHDILSHLNEQTLDIDGIND